MVNIYKCNSCNRRVVHLPRILPEYHDLFDIYTVGHRVFPLTDTALHCQWYIFHPKSWNLNSKKILLFASLKMMKNTFYFISEALFVLKIFKILFDFLAM